MDKTNFMNRVFQGQPYTFNSSYGYRIHPITGVRTFHYGEDYGTKGVRCALYSPVFGIVTESAYNTARGYYITIKTQFGFVRMQHLNAKGIATGTQVAPGTKIGVCGTTGASTGVHLHIEYKTTSGGALNPSNFISVYKEPYQGGFPVAAVSTTYGTEEDIVKWQKFLCWYSVDVATDGNFGPDTKAKTVAFQQNYGLLADGKAGPKTIAVAKTVLR